MVINEKQLHQIYHNLLAILLTFALVYGMDTYFLLRIPAILVLVLSIVIGVSIGFIHNYRRLLLTYILLIGFIGLLLGYFWIKSISIKDWLIEWIRWIKLYDTSIELYSKAYGLSSVIALIIIFSVVFLLLVQYRVTLLITAIFALAGMVLFSIAKISIPKITTAICLFYLFYIAIKEVSYIYHKKRSIKEKPSGILYLLPVGIIFILTVYILPTKADPISWEPVKKAYYNIQLYIKETWKDIKLFVTKGSGEFAIAMTGYNEKGTTLSQESIQKANDIALSIIAHRLEEPVYLNGSVRNIYTGEKWTTDELPRYKWKEYELNYAQMVYLASKLDVEEITEEQWMKRVSFQIKYDAMKTKTMFYPMYLEKYTLYNGYVRLDDYTATMKFHKNMGSKTNYKVTFYKYNLSSESLQEIFRNASDYAFDSSVLTATESKWIEKNDEVLATMMFDYHGKAELFNDKTLLKQLYQREQDIYQNYTQLPEDLPQRVYDLGGQIVEGLSNDYDRLKAIELYLSQLEYSTEPGKTPKGEDFVDYFLFDSQKGFCTSFASAMAILGRTIGIPTRYVEGFVANLSEYSGSEYLVRNHRAHAWVEAYIKGIGWISFEPTPIYQQDRYQKWKPKAGKANVDMSYDDYLTREDDMINRHNPDSIPPRIGPVLEKDKEKEESHQLAIYLGVSISIMVILVILTYQILQIRMKNRYKKACDNQKFYLCFLRVLFLLKKEGYALQESETIQMYAKRVPKGYSYNGIHLEEIARQYMEYRYGELDRTTEHIAIIERYLLGLETHHREQLSKLKYGWEQFLWSTGRSS